jgi:hypothetical protein
LLYDGSYDFQLLANTARKARPDYDRYIPYGKPEEPTPIAKGSYTIDSSKATEELGIQREWCS